MLIFFSWIIGWVASICAAPLLLILGVGSVVGILGFLYEADFFGVLGGLACLLWSWAGFTGLSGYWRWMGLHGQSLSDYDVATIKAIQHKGIWGVLAFLPISPAFSWFVIPIFCFIIAIFLDIRNKINSINCQEKSDVKPT